MANDYFYNGEPPSGNTFPRLWYCRYLLHVDVFFAMRTVWPPKLRSRNVWHISLLFLFVSNFLIPTHPSPPIANQVETRIIACLSLLIHSLEYGVMATLDGVNGTVCNATQYFQSLQSRDSDGPWIILTRGDTIGLIVNIY